MSRRDDDQRRQEYLLMEIRLTGEDIKAQITDKFEKRICSLERWRNLIAGGFAAFILLLKNGAVSVK